MNDDLRNVWQPNADDIAGANVTALAQRLGVDGYDALLTFSYERPAEYWRVVLDYCGIAWDADYHTYLDGSAGTEFPKWFAGGRLN